MDNTSLEFESEIDSGIDSTNSTGDGMVCIRVSIADLNIQRYLQFHQDDTIWSAKQQILLAIAKDLPDGINYGLFCPPMNGRAGKFLDEERPLRDYPLSTPIGFLELKYKRRVYKTPIEMRKHQEVNTKAKARKFFEYVQKGDVAKVTTKLSNGLDPNFIDTESGETPLTRAVTVSNATRIIIALVSGGAHLDFRNAKGLTAMHIAAIKGKEESIKALLDLGSSTNYKDNRELTPLYHCILAGANVECVRMLLYDHATLGITDEYKSTELHQLCKSGKVQLLEELIYYGADMNSQNSSGNTPLHVCAANNREDCARILLFRGASRDICNFSNQDPIETAIVSGNNKLALVIKEFSEDEVVPYQELPKFNEKRRLWFPSSSLGSLRSRSSSTLAGLLGSVRLSDVPTGSVSNIANLLGGVSLSEGPRRSVSNLTRTSANLGGSTGKLNSSNSVKSSPKLSFFNDYSGQRRISNGDTASLQNFNVNSKLSCFGDIGEQSSDAASLQNFNMNSNHGTNGNREYEEDARPVVPPRQNRVVNSRRTVFLKPGRVGFGFILRGAKASNRSSHLTFMPTPDFPALQYFDVIEPNSMADRAGIRPRDFLLEVVNGHDVRSASHAYTVQLIKEATEMLSLTVMTVKRSSTTRSPASSVHSPNIQKEVQRVPRFSTFSRQSGMALLENLDLMLNEHDAEDDVFMDKMASSIGIDSSNKVASLRPNHGKRLASAAPKLSAVEFDMNAADARPLDNVQMPNSRNAQIPMVSKQSSMIDGNMKNKRMVLNRDPPKQGGAPDGRAGQISRQAAQDVFRSHSDASSMQPVILNIPVPQVPTARIQPRNAGSNSRTNEQVEVKVLKGGSQGGKPLPAVPPSNIPPPPPPPPPPVLHSEASPSASYHSSVRSRDGPLHSQQKLPLPPSSEELAEKLYVWSSEIDENTPSVPVIPHESNVPMTNHQPNSKNNNPETGKVKRQESPVSFQTDLAQLLAKKAAGRKTFSEESFLHSTKPTEPTENSCFPVKLLPTKPKNSKNSNNPSKGSDAGNFVLPPALDYDSDTVSIHNVLNTGNKMDTSEDLNSFASSSILDPTESSLDDFIVPPPPMEFSSDEPAFPIYSKPLPPLPQIPPAFPPPSPPPPPPPSSPPPSPPSSPTFPNNFPPASSLPVPNYVKDSEISSQNSSPLASKRNTVDLSRNLLAMPIDNWTIDDVTSWLNSMNLKEHSERFKLGCVDGSKLKTLGRNDFIALGVTQVGQRMNIERAVKKIVLANNQ